MELWVRSQDKTTLIKSFEIYIEENEESSYLIKAKETSHILGSYRTIERALEVLDEIQRHLVVINDENNNCFYVYEMPKE